MKDLYAWVPYFKELSQKIADGGEDYLIGKAKNVRWKPEGPDSPLLKYGEQNIDPFSFLYTLAANSSGAESRRRIYASVRSIFDIESELPLENENAFYFPTPNRVHTLFHSGDQGNPQLLWRLFRRAITGIDHIAPEDFEGALEIKGVALTKLTHTLFLLNANEFLPIDASTASLGLFSANNAPTHATLSEYMSLMGVVRSAFPGCEPFEINLFAYLCQRKLLTVHSTNCFQVSSNVYNEAKDCWSDFNSGYHVFTGSPGATMQYPLRKPEPGDVVLVRYAKQGRGIGVVYQNDYKEDGWAEAKSLHVLWVNKTATDQLEGVPIIGFSHAGNAPRKAFRNSTAYAQTFELLDRLSPIETTTPSPQPSVRHPRNRILYGPPGTGKTWFASNHALAIIDGTAVSSRLDRERFDDLRFQPVSENGTSQIEMVTFHQNFSYEDFIEGIRPLLTGDRVSYELRDGIFKRIAKAAINQPDMRFVLIIDEINRGNIAKIFGELITLIEDSRRKGQNDQTFVTLPYSGDTFGVPDNLYLIGTMNTADRSIQLLDTALRRRFTFMEMMPNPKHERVSNNVNGVDCTKMLAAINKRINAMLDREHQIGHTYLLDVQSLDQLATTFQSRIFPLLQEYFFDDWAKINAILGNNAFVTQQDIPNSQMLTDFIDDERKLYERLPEDHADWRDPSEYRKIYVSIEAEE